MEDKYTFVKLIQTQKNQEVAKEDNLKRSRDNLKRLVEKRIRTTMIGALACVEEKFGQFWKTENNEKMTAEQASLYQLFQEIRSVILDNGNNQIRLLDKDIDNFNVEAKKYHIQFKVDPS